MIYSVKLSAWQRTRHFIWLWHLVIKAFKSLLFLTSKYRPQWKIYWGDSTSLWEKVQTSFPNLKFALNALCHIAFDSLQSPSSSLGTDFKKMWFYQRLISCTSGSVFYVLHFPWEGELFSIALGLLYLILLLPVKDQRQLPSSEQLFENPDWCLMNAMF